MIQKSRNIWHEWLDGKYVVVPTNMQVDRNGYAVMGAGMAKTAALSFRGLAEHYGPRVRSEALVVTRRNRLVMLPTKDHWRDPSSVELIAEGLGKLLGYAEDHPGLTFALPRLGCGLGTLDWETQVQPLMADLDDRFTVCSPARGIEFYHRCGTGAAILSNFSEHPLNFNGRSAPTLEHAFQASKAADWDDKIRILRAKTPQEAKALGRKVLMRDDWPLVRFRVMRSWFLKKVSVHEDVRNYLRSTGTERLIHRMDRDAFWGDGPDRNGMDCLGYIAESVRESITR